MKIGDLIKPMWQTSDEFWLILKAVSGDDIPPVVRTIDPHDLFLEVSNAEGKIMHLFSYECEVVSCK